MNVICDFFFHAGKMWVFKQSLRMWGRVYKKSGIKEYGCLGNYIVKSDKIKSMDDISSIKIRIYLGQTNIY